MNYYYDIILNWNENIPYNFYEWNDYDYLELIKKIPLIKIKHKTLVDIWSNNNSSLIRLSNDNIINIMPIMIHQKIGLLIIKLTNSKKLYPIVNKFKYIIVKKMPILIKNMPKK